MLYQVLTMVQHRQVRAASGTVIPITAGTICLHGDGEYAVKFATILRGELERNGIQVAAP